jgi:hypothetical protein
MLKLNRLCSNNLNVLKSYTGCIYSFIVYLLNAVYKLLKYSYIMYLLNAVYRLYLFIYCVQNNSMTSQLFFCFNCTTYRCVYCKAYEILILFSKATPPRRQHYDVSKGALLSKPYRPLKTPLLIGWPQLHSLSWIRLSPPQTQILYRRTQNYWGADLARKDGMLHVLDIKIHSHIDCLCRYLFEIVKWREVNDLILLITHDHHCLVHLMRNK